MNRQNNNPFGPAQTKLFKFILSNPACTMAEIHQSLFNDKRTNYVSNLLYENENYIHVDKFDNTSMPNTYKVKVGELGKMIDIKTWVSRGEFVGVTAQPAI